MEYNAEIFPNGRIALIKNEDYENALENEKEILVFCGGWSGGYARALGANKVPDWYDVNNGNDCFDCYAYDVKDQTFSTEDLSKFHKVIVTDGVKIYMKTGEPATQYFGIGFSDWDTKFEDYQRRHYGTSVTADEFEKMRHVVDRELTLHMVHGKNDEDRKSIQSAIGGYFH